MFSLDGFPYAIKGWKLVALPAYHQEVSRNHFNLLLQCIDPKLGKTYLLLFVSSWNISINFIMSISSTKLNGQKQQMRNNLERQSRVINLQLEQGGVRWSYHHRSSRKIRWLNLIRTNLQPLKEWARERVIPLPIHQLTLTTCILWGSNCYDS